MADETARGRGLGGVGGGGERAAVHGPDADVGFGHAGCDEFVVAGEVETIDAVGG